jgi:hypothetical protein
MLAALAYKQHDCATAAKHFAQRAQLTATQPAALAEDGACLVELNRPAEAVFVFRLARWRDCSALEHFREIGGPVSFARSSTQHSHI